MKLHVITIGEPKHEYAKLGCALYQKRLARYHKLRVTHLKDSKRGGVAGLQEESARILESVGNSTLVTLEVTGEQLSSENLCERLARFANAGISELAFVVGGPDGLSQAITGRAALRWSLSTLTMPHDLAQLVMLEALYRAATLERGEPYHRA